MLNLYLKILTQKYSHSSSKEAPPFQTKRRFCNELAMRLEGIKNTEPNSKQCS
jgi:hypothetical protein